VHACLHEPHHLTSNRSMSFVPTCPLAIPSRRMAAGRYKLKHYRLLIRDCSMQPPGSFSVNPAGSFSTHFDVKERACHRCYLQRRRHLLSMEGDACTHRTMQTDSHLLHHHRLHRPAALTTLLAPHLWEENYIYHVSHIGFGFH